MQARSLIFSLCAGEAGLTPRLRFLGADRLSGLRERRCQSAVLAGSLRRGERFTVLPLLRGFCQRRGPIWDNVARRD
jgi:hypothetical protein